VAAPGRGGAAADGDLVGTVGQDGGRSRIVVAADEGVGAGTAIDLVVAGAAEDEQAVVGAVNRIVAGAAVEERDGGDASYLEGHVAEIENIRGAAGVACVVAADGEAAGVDDLDVVRELSGNQPRTEIEVIEDKVGAANVLKRVGAGGAEDLVV